jgi:hypothetical protein
LQISIVAPPGRPTKRVTPPSANTSTIKSAAGRDAIERPLRGRGLLLGYL